MIKLFVFIIICSTSFLSGKKIHVITTNDLLGAIVPQKAHFMNPNFPPDILGWAAYFEYVTNLRNELQNKNEGILILDGGNFFQGNPVGLVDGGKSIIEWMNLIGYDAITLGPKDFYLGVENIKKLSDIADFPFLIANANIENTKKYIIKTINGVKVAIVGIIPSTLKELVMDHNLEGVEIDNEVEILNNIVKDVKSQGADIVIVLSSNGIPWEREKEYNSFISELPEFSYKDGLNALELGYFSENVDLIVAGGNSKGYPEIWYDPKSHVYITQNYGNGTEFGHLVIDIEEKRLSGISSAVNGRIGQTLLADNFNVDYDTFTLLEDLGKRANSILSDNASTYNKEIILSNLELKKNRWSCPNLNLEDELEIVTWNCEFFPKSDYETIIALAEVIKQMNLDLIGFQEIRKRGWFDDLMRYLPEYDYAIAMQSSFMDNAFIFKKDKLTLLNQYEPFSDNDYNFAGRPPLQCDFLYESDGKSIMFSVINLHFKCCDSGLLRRKRASEMLYNYTDNLYNKNNNIVILGDWNDDLNDNDGEHCFDPFLKDNRMYFANDKIIKDESQVSYPKEPFRSFLDHILITEEFLNSNTNYRVMTIPIDDYMGGFDVYEKYISDHMPVMIGVPIN